MAANPPYRMPAALRVTVKVVATLLALSGCGWLVVHFFFGQQTEFGVGPSEWEAPLLRLHGMIAVASVFLFGWIGSRHITPSWRMQRNRRTGLAMAAVLAILIVSGYALYYLTSDSTHTIAAVTHEILGIVCIVLALAHWSHVRAPFVRTADREGAAQQNESSARKRTA